METQTANQTTIGQAIDTIANEARENVSNQLANQPAGLVATQSFDATMIPVMLMVVLLVFTLAGAGQEIDPDKRKEKSDAAGLIGLLTMAVLAIDWYIAHHLLLPALQLMQLNLSALYASIIMSGWKFYASQFQSAFAGVTGSMATLMVHAGLAIAIAILAAQYVLG